MGFVGNINYAQMIDMAAGFMGLDPAGDDGCQYGYWPWESEWTPSEQAASLRSEIFGLPAEPVAGAKPPVQEGVFFGRGHLPLPPGAAAPAARPAAPAAK